MRPIASHNNHDRVPKQQSALDKQIVANPTDPEPYLVLADELIAAGDRHGELIAVQNARRTKPKDKRLEKRELDLFKAIGPALFGALWPTAKLRQKKDGERPPIHIDWFQGFVRGVRLSASETDSLSTLTPAFLKLPIARFVQHLAFGDVESEPGNPNYQSVIETLDALKLPTTISSLFFGDFENEIFHEHTWNMIRKLDVLSKKFPKLLRLRIHSCGGLAGPIDLDLTLPRLRELEVRTDYTESGDLIAQASTLKTLERLTLSFGVNTNTEAKLADLAPILAGKKLPALTALSVEWIDFGPALVDAIVKSKLAARLVHLGIRSAHLHDASVDLLLGNKARFPNLQSIDVELNYLTKPAQKRLRGLCSSVVLGTQWDPDEDYLE